MQTCWFLATQFVRCKFLRVNAWLFIGMVYVNRVKDTLKLEDSLIISLINEWDTVGSAKCLKILYVQNTKLPAQVDKACRVHGVKWQKNAPLWGGWHLVSTPTSGSWHQCVQLHVFLPTVAHPLGGEWAGGGWGDVFLPTVAHLLGGGGWAGRGGRLGEWDEKVTFHPKHTQAFFLSFFFPQTVQGFFWGLGGYKARQVSRIFTDSFPHRKLLFEH